MGKKKYRGAPSSTNIEFSICFAIDAQLFRHAYLAYVILE